jgi:hypothetical protein
VQGPIQPYDPNANRSGQLSLSQIRDVGAVVVAWGKLENSINDLIWVINGKDLATGRFDTQELDVSKLLSALQKAISTNMPGQSFSNLRKSITDIINVINQYKSERNSVVHGSWARHNGIPGVISLRFETTSNEFVTFETFTPDRMKAIKNVAISAIKNCHAVISRLEALRKTPSSQQTKDEPNRP